MIAFVVEDDQDQRDLVRETLEEAGWTVELAEDGIAALGRIRRVEPDVILLDLLMPHLDGIEMLKMLRSKGAGRIIPVIITTGIEVDPDVRALADCVLGKPFSSKELIEVLTSLVGGGSNRRVAVLAGRSGCAPESVAASQCEHAQQVLERPAPPLAAPPFGLDST